MLRLNEVIISIIIIYHAPTDHNLATKAHMFELVISKTLKWQLYLPVWQQQQNTSV